MFYPSPMAAQVMLTALNQSPQNGLETGINLALFAIGVTAIFIILSGLIILFLDDHNGENNLKR
jgi:hypothetical protein